MGRDQVRERLDQAVPLIAISTLASRRKTLTGRTADVDTGVGQLCGFAYLVTENMCADVCRIGTDGPSQTLCRCTFQDRNDVEAERCAGFCPAE